VTSDQRHGILLQASEERVMRIQVSESLPLSAEEAFLLIRDNMSKLVPYLFDIEEIRVTERREDGEQIHIVNLWQGDLTRVPAGVRKFVKRDLFSWTDYATWNTATRSASWRLEPRVGARAFDCSGTTALVEDGDTCRLEMDIELVIHPGNVPGVPKFLARRFQPQIESAIRTQIEPNMKNLAVSVRAYVAAQS
jgi:hypothetical protein